MSIVGNNNTIITLTDEQTELFAEKFADRLVKDLGAEGLIEIAKAKWPDFAKKLDESSAKNDAYRKEVLEKLDALLNKGKKVKG